MKDGKPAAISTGLAQRLRNAEQKHDTTEHHPDNLYQFPGGSESLCQDGTPQLPDALRNPYSTLAEAQRGPGARPIERSTNLIARRSTSSVLEEVRRRSSAPHASMEATKQVDQSRLPRSCNRVVCSAAVASTVRISMKETKMIKYLFVGNSMGHSNRVDNLLSIITAYYAYSSLLYFILGIATCAIPTTVGVGLFAVTLLLLKFVMLKTPLSPTAAAVLSWRWWIPSPVILDY